MNQNGLPMVTSLEAFPRFVGTMVFWGTVVVFVFLVGIGLLGTRPFSAVRSSSQL